MTVGQPSPRLAGRTVFVAQGMMVLRVPLAGPSKPLSAVSSQLAAALAVDCLAGQLYWTDTTNRLIRRAGLDGSDAEIFIR